MCAAVAKGRAAPAARLAAEFGPTQVSAASHEPPVRGRELAAKGVRVRAGPASFRRVAARRAAAIQDAGVTETADTHQRERARRIILLHRRHERGARAREPVADATVAALLASNRATHQFERRTALRGTHVGREERLKSIAEAGVRRLEAQRHAGL